MFFRMAGDSSLLDRAGRPDALAKHELLDLAGRRLRELAEYHAPRRLEPRQVGAAMLNQLGLGDARAGPDLDERAGRLAPLRVGLRNHRRRQHGGMAVERVLDLDRADVFAAR